ncbi:hypothetical protein BH10BAC4_BH10BAC4_21230 [soil metagenome]
MLKQLLHFIKHHAVRLTNLSHTIPEGVRIDIKNEMERRIYNDIFVDGDYDEAILKLISTAEETLTVLDLGSNVMFFTFRLIQLASEKPSKSHYSIHCIEASDKLVSESHRRIQNSHFSTERFQINIHQGLLGEPGGHSTFYHFKDHGLSSVFRKNGKPETISFINVSDLLKGANKIDLLKCDIEGSEGDFITHYGDILKKTSIAIFEFHFEYCSLEACISIIQKTGLIYSKIIRESPQSRIELFWR